MLNTRETVVVLVPITDVVEDEEGGGANGLLFWGGSHTVEGEVLKNEAIGKTIWEGSFSRGVVSVSDCIIFDAKTLYKMVGGDSGERRQEFLYCVYSKYEGRGGSVEEGEINDDGMWTASRDFMKGDIVHTAEMSERGNVDYRVEEEEGITFYAREDIKRGEVLVVSREEDGGRK